MNKNKITITTLLVLMFFAGFGIMATSYNAEPFSHEEHAQLNI